MSDVRDERILRCCTWQEAENNNKGKWDGEDREHGKKEGDSEEKEGTDEACEL
jgi:hypothetical protein